VQPWGGAFSCLTSKGWIKNATSALPGGRSGSPLTCRSQGIVSDLQTSARKGGPKSSQLADETAPLIYRNEPRCRTIAVEPAGALASL
jgi:hypothetical protein